MKEQPEALRIAEWFEGGYGGCEYEAAAELRRLHEVNQELLEALKVLSAEEWRDDNDPILYRARIKARTAIAKAGETK